MIASRSRIGCIVCLDAPARKEICLCVAQAQKQAAFPGLRPSNARPLQFLQSPNALHFVGNPYAAVQTPSLYAQTIARSQKPVSHHPAGSFDIARPAPRCGHWVHSTEFLEVHGTAATGGWPWVLLGGQVSLPYCCSVNRMSNTNPDAANSIRKVSNTVRLGSL
jgi:hypothetical protein